MAAKIQTAEAPMVKSSISKSEDERCGTNFFLCSGSDDWKSIKNKWGDRKNIAKKCDSKSIISFIQRRIVQQWRTWVFRTLCHVNSLLYRTLLFNIENELLLRVSRQRGRQLCVMEIFAVDATLSVHQRSAAVLYRRRRRIPALPTVIFLAVDACPPRRLIFAV